MTNTGLVNDLPERLTRAFVELFDENVYAFWDGFQGGGPGYYGVHLEEVAANGSELNLVLTFHTGKRYCCFEFADHFAFYSVRGWSRLRKCMDRHGLGHLPLPVIRKVLGVVEKGAVATPSPQVAAFVHEGCEYQAGPFSPEMEKASG